MSRNFLLMTFFFLIISQGCMHLKEPTPELAEKNTQPEKSSIKEVEKVGDWEGIKLPPTKSGNVESEINQNKNDSKIISKNQIFNLPTEEGGENSKPQEPYRLNVGDVIEISVLDEPEMTRNVTVIPDGTITYLLVGEMKAKGLTIAELRKSLTKALEEFFIAPYVSIITRTINLPPEEVQKVSVIGAVKQNGNFDWNKGDRVLDLIAESGGLLYTQTELGSRTTANLKASYLSRKGKEVDIDFYKLIKLGDMRYNILLKPGDFIYIADAEESTVVVMGEVYNPRIIPLTRNMTLVEALSICGGFTREAYQSRVVILRSNNGEGKYVEVDVNDILHGRDVKNLMLEGGDIVFVPEQTLSEYARWAGFLVDIADLVLKGYQVREAIRFPKLNRHTPSD